MWAAVCESNPGEPHWLMYGGGMSSARDTTRLLQKFWVIEAEARRRLDDHRPNHLRRLSQYLLHREWAGLCVKPEGKQYIYYGSGGGYPAGTPGDKSVALWFETEEEAQRVADIHHSACRSAHRSEVEMRETRVPYDEKTTTPPKTETSMSSDPSTARQYEFQVPGYGTIALELERLKKAIIERTLEYDNPCISGKVNFLEDVFKVGTAFTLEQFKQHVIRMVGNYRTSIAAGNLFLSNLGILQPKVTFSVEVDAASNSEAEAKLRDAGFRPIEPLRS